MIRYLLVIVMPDLWGSFLFNIHTQSSILSRSVELEGNKVFSSYSKVRIVDMTRPPYLRVATYTSACDITYYDITG